MPEILTQIWEYNFFVTQVLFLIVLFELPAQIRRRNRYAYTPIYFMFFPLGHSNELYAQYFSKFDYYDIEPDLDEHQLAKIRLRIVAVAVVSMFFSTIIAPAIVGVVAGFFVEVQSFTNFLVALLVYKVLLLSKSLLNMRYSQIFERPYVKMAVFAIYFLYLIVVFVILNETYNWAKDSVESVGMFGTIKNLTIWLVLDNLWALIIVPAVTAAVTVLITNKQSLG